MMSRQPLVLRPRLASVRSRPGLLSRPEHCLGHCLDNVHEHRSQVKKKSTKILKIFLCMI